MNRPPGLWEANPRSGERHDEIKVRKRSRTILGLMVLLVVALNLFLFLKFGVHFGSKASPAGESNSPSPPAISR
jgi:hypothetical protein